MSNRKFEITDAKRGAAFTVRVVTRAQNNEIAGILDDQSIKIRLVAAPQQANEALINFLSERLSVPESAIEIIAGKENRDKWISVEGITTSDVTERLQPDPGAAETE